jgi:AsmA protein
MQAKISLQSTGNNERAIMSNLGGTVFANFQDGSIRGLNVAQMVRSLTSGTLSGWQEGPEQSTELSQLSASFRVERGQATTNDLTMVGPLVRMTGAGTVDVAAKSLALRVEPKLVMTTEGQGRAADPVGLGIPVVIEGPWAAPRIYPDMAGILDNPDAAYSKLKEMGKGLFGPGGALSGLGAGLGGGMNNPPGNGSAAGGTNPNGANADPLGRLGETIGNLLQQGLNRPRNLPAPGAPPAPAAPSSSATPGSPAPAQPEQAAPDSQPMNDVLRRLFNR